MKAYEKMILTFFEKYNKVDFDLLNIELKLPKTLIVDIIENLIKNKYFELSNGEIKLTEKGKMNTYIIWNELTYCMQNEEKQIEFRWDELYIPKNFMNN